MVRYFQSGCVVAAMALVIGCGGEDTGRPPTYPVTGTVTVDGKPVEGAKVTFVPVSDQHKGAGGVTDASGAFQLGTFEKVDGAMAGNYKVVIKKVPKIEEPEVQLPPGIEPGTPEAADFLLNYIPDPTSADLVGDANMGKPPEPPKSELPLKYATKMETDLTAEVTADGENNFPFDLKN